MIRVAILGTGIGAEHLAGYRSLPERFIVSAICDLDTERALAATGPDTSIRVVDNIDDILLDKTIDLVDVCLPPHLHVPVSLQVFAANKHVICEKPIARSLKEIDLLKTATLQSGKKFFPVFQYRYGLAIAQLKSLISEGLAGRALVASAETHWNREANYYAIPWRGTWHGESGGAVLSHAIHCHDLLCHILGPVDTVSAFMDTRVNPIETEDCAAIAMRMVSGALATSSITLGAGSDTTRLRFCFEGLTAESGINPYKPAEDTWTFTARANTQQQDVDRVVKEVLRPHAGFAGLFEAVADALEGKDEKAISFNDGARSIELVTAIYQSAHSGTSVTLPISEETPYYAGWIQPQEPNRKPVNTN